MAESTLNIALQYFDGCPNWKQADADLRALIGELGLSTEILYQLIETAEAAEEHDFRGSPTIRINGEDPFAADNAPVGLGCRLYQTDSGPAGSPTREQLRAAINARGSLPQEH